MFMCQGECERITFETLCIHKIQNVFFHCWFSKNNNSLFSKKMLLLFRRWRDNWPARTNWSPWTGLGGTVLGSSGLGVAWNGNMWVAVGIGPAQLAIAYSFDGINWTNATSNPFGTTAGTAVAWNGTIWTAVGVASPGFEPIATSLDGINWSGVVGTSALFTTCYGIAWGNDKWIALGDSFGGTTTMAYSYDAITWTPLGLTLPTTPFDVQAWSATWNGITWVAVGESNFTFAGKNTIAYSSDGITWTPVAASMNFFNHGTGVCWNGVRFIATGAEPGIGNRIKYSSDGINWYNAEDSNTLQNVAWHVKSNSYIGASVSDSQIVLNNSGFRLSNSLDVASEKYYNNGYTNFSMSVQSNLLP